jgi:hypothetical protein
MWVRADTRGLFSKIDVSRKTASNTISDPSLPRWWTFVLRTPAYGPWWFPASTSSRRRGVGAVLLFGSGAEELFFGSVTDHADRTDFDQARRSITIGHRRSHALSGCDAPLLRSGAKEQLQNDAKRQRTRSHAQTSTSRLDTLASRSYLTDYAFRPSSIAILEHRAWRRVGNDLALFYEKSKKPLLQVVPDAVTIDRGLARLRAHRRVVQRSSGIRFAVALVQPPEPIV